MTTGRRVGIRWTIGDVSGEGFEALRLAIHGACRVFGRQAAFAVCVNSIGVEEARERTGALPVRIEWIAAAGTLPVWLRPHVDPAAMVEGKAWKFDPLHVFHDRWELAFDNDCILWAMPPSIARWLASGARDRCLIAADVTLAHGAFTPWAGDEPRNAGIRGIPPRFDLEGVLRELLELNPVPLTSELDEQGLQVAAVGRRAPPGVVSVEEVSICSPFPPHLPQLGSHGAHFVGLNDRWLPWEFHGRPATEWVRAHWRRHRVELQRRVGVSGWARG